jgi:hypothetical protein
VPPNIAGGREGVKKWREGGKAMSLNDLISFKMNFYRNTCIACENCPADEGLRVTQMKHVFPCSQVDGVTTTVIVMIDEV